MDTLGAKRLSARLSNAFILDLLKLGAHGRDVIDPLIRTALLHAGVANVMRDPDLQVRYAGFDQDIPDELRRPASINSIAESLSIPFETVRRRIAALVEEGVCRPSGRGVIVPSAVTSSPFFRIACEVQQQKLAELYRTLRDLHLVAPPSSPPRDWPQPPLRLVGRFTVEFVLRYRELVAEYVPDVVSSAILMDIVCANTEHLSRDADNGGIGPDGFVADAERRPVTVPQLSQRLGISPETMRRHLGVLASKGFCERSEDGYVVPAAILAGAPFTRLVIENDGNLTRLFGQLASFGALGDLERASADPA